eukprot:12884268-Prorocentrum_lima.AAC.1
MGPNCPGPIDSKRIQGHAGVHKEHKYIQWYCSQVSATCCQCFRSTERLCVVQHGHMYCVP